MQTCFRCEHKSLLVKVYGLGGAAGGARCAFGTMIFAWKQPLGLREVLFMERVKHKPRIWSTAGNVYGVICVPVLWVCPYY